MLQRLTGKVVNWNWKAQGLKRTVTRYKYPYNINREEHAVYLKKVEKAQHQVAVAEMKNLVPRRMRKIYDRPKHDLDLTDFSAWRLYQEEDGFDKGEPHGAPVVSKLYLQPKWLLHAFGLGLPPRNHTKSAHREFVFEDNDLSRYLLYEYRNTTFYCPNDPNFDYEHQEHLANYRKKIKRLSPEEFWTSEDKFQFRLNATMYAQHLKFGKWLQQTIEERKAGESYDQFIDRTYGPVCTFNRKADASTFQPFEPMILKVTPNHFQLDKKGQKLKEPTVVLGKKLGEEYRIQKKDDTESAGQATQAKSN